MNTARRKKPLRKVPFDAADYLGDDATRLAYLNAVLAEGDPQAVVAALGTVARARGMSRVAKRSGLGRESLYKALSDRATQPSRRSSKSRRLGQVVRRLHSASTSMS